MPSVSCPSRHLFHSTGYKCAENVEIKCTILQHSSNKVSFMLYKLLCFFCFLLLAEYVFTQNYRRYFTSNANKNVHITMKIGVSRTNKHWSSMIYDDSGRQSFVAMVTTDNESRVYNNHRGLYYCMSISRVALIVFHDLWSSIMTNIQFCFRLSKNEI